MIQRGKDQPLRKKAMSPWKARCILGICLALAFAVPYIAVQLFALAKDRQWQRSGLSPYEISRWRESGINDVSEAIRWRNSRFQPPGARLWKEEGIEPEVAYRWNDQGFGPRESKHWSEQGFSPEEAAPWRDEGFIYPDAKKWRSAGVSAAQAREKRKKGIHSP
jgi:hypothetical protein